MRPLTAAQASQWCEEHGIALEHGRPARPAGSVTCPIPSDAGARVALVNEQVSKLLGDEDVLVWFGAWGTWPSAERPHIFERFLASYRETRQLNDAPAFVFSAAESEDCLSFATLGVLFLWDTAVVAADGRRVALYSHDEMVDVFGLSPTASV